MRLRSLAILALLALVAGPAMLGAQDLPVVDKNGGDSKSVHFLELPFTEMSAALKAGRIDAAMLSEPVLSESRNDVEPLANIDLATFAIMARSRYGDTLSVALLQPELDEAFKSGQLKTPFDAAQWVNEAQPYWRGLKR